MIGATPRRMHPRHARHELPVATAVDDVRPHRRRPDPSRRVRREHELLRLALRARVVRTVGKRRERRVFVRLLTRWRGTGRLARTRRRCSRAPAARPTLRGGDRVPRSVHVQPAKRLPPAARRDRRRGVKDRRRTRSPRARSCPRRARRPVAIRRRATPATATATGRARAPSIRPATAARRCASRPAPWRR